MHQSLDNAALTWKDREIDTGTILNHVDTFDRLGNKDNWKLALPKCHIKIN